jgi:RimJ/RimL family protein N-acetyltransferase
MQPIHDGDLTIRPMRDDPEEFNLLVRWRAEPHVHEWWDPDDPVPTMEEVIEHYGPAVRGEEPTTACVFELDGRPAGYVQFYPWLPYLQEEPSIDIRPDERTFGLDIHIGEPDLIEQGLGTRVVELVCRYLENDLGVSWVALITEVANHRAQRAYEKAGFRKVRQVLDTDTRGGQRAVCWLMERRRG